MTRSDICIAGAGIVGLSIALELHARGMTVIVVESGSPMREASTAAAGMLAADDPHNPAELSALSHLSVSLYASFLDRIQSLSGVAVPYQTAQTLQAIVGNAVRTLRLETIDELQHDGILGKALAPSCGFSSLDEHSLDPRQLGPALIAAIAATSIRTIYHSPVISAKSSTDTVLVMTPTVSIESTHFVDCTGAWANSREPDAAFKVVPIKGQMLALALPTELQLRTVIRTEELYIVPRTTGPNAGRAIVGATVEDLGFDKHVHADSIENLRQQAIALLPDLASAAVLESWAGLRPATPDRLPLLGPYPMQRHHWIATGHYRNGILLAPATARVMAQLLSGEEPSVFLDAFSPSRLQPASLSNRSD